MSDTARTTTGGCLCGAVRYEAAGEPVYVPYCHCESCRRATGAVAAVYVMFERDRVRFPKGERRLYASSPGVERGFCATCGTSLTWESEWGGKTVIEIHVGSLDDAEAFPPDRHAFHGERIAWFDAADDLPRYHGTSIGTEPDGVGPAK